MKKVIQFIFIMAALFIGCGQSLRPDSNPYAITSNAPTAEINVCGKKFLGLGACSIVKGENLSTLKVSVQGYNSGTIRVTSDKCGVDYDMRYSGHRDVSIPLYGQALESCILAVSVQPEFEGERESGLVIGSLKGFIRIRVIEDSSQSWKGFFTKVSESGNSFIEFSGVDSRVVIRGCDSLFDKQVLAINGRIRIALSDLPSIGVKGCVYEGLVDDGENQVFFTWMVWRTSKNYVPAIKPEMFYDGEDIVIDGENATSVIGIDDKYVLDKKASLKFDRSKKHTIRTLTIGGRNNVGEYDPSSGAVKWVM